MTEMYKYKAYHKHSLSLNCRSRFSRLIRVFTDNSQQNPPFLIYLILSLS